MVIIGFKFPASVLFFGESIALQPGEYYLVVKALEGERTYQIILTDVPTALLTQALILSLLLQSQPESNIPTFIISFSLGVTVLLILLKMRKKQYI